ncbi:hypothetical protein V8F20_001001 [Naviculisporaceae sp. PSN 640]
MPSILPRKLDWYKEIDQTTARNSFVICRPDEFPLAQVQTIAERVLNPEPTPIFTRKPIPPCSQKSDEIIIHELKAVAGVFYIEEAAIIGCLHLLTWEVARWHLWSKIKPDLKNADKDEIFTSRISVYLQCIVIARKASSVLVHEGEALAARQLLRILHHGKTKEFPSIVKLLTTITDASCGDLLPFDFLAEVLRRAEWREKLKARLAHLQKSQRWVDAYSLVDGLQDFSQRSDLPQDVRRWLPSLFFHYPMWASWRPNLSRIQAWKAGTTPEQRAQLAPIFELEGPDTTLQQRSTFRHSSTGAFPNARAHGTHNDKDILDRLLDLLDSAVRIGPNAINLFIHLTLTATSTAVPGTYELTWHHLHQLSAAFSPNVDSVPGVILSFLQSLRPGTEVQIYSRMTSCTAVLPLLNSSQPLQTFFGESIDISIRAPRILSDAQKHFCSLLIHSQQQLLPFGLAILFLGRALLSSTWLLDRWKPAFMNMLHAMPSEAEIRARFKAIQTEKGEVRQAHMDYLAVSLGGSEMATGRGTPPVTPPPPVVIEDDIWQAELDADRHALRKALLALRASRTRGLDLDLATRCLKAAATEHDAFVKGVTGYMVGGSDQACVNMARFLAPRVVGPGRSGSSCWVGLCLWMMRRRPRGLLERLGADLTVESWNEWVGCLSRLFGDGHLGDKGGLGFTAERIRQITIWKMSRGGRVHSGSSTSSTVSI